MIWEKSWSKLEKRLNRLWLSRNSKQREASLTTKDNESNDKKKNLTRRDFLKYGAGVAAVAAGAAAMLDKIPFKSSELSKAPAPTGNGEAMVVAVQGDVLTLITGERSVRVRDANLASILASKAEEGD